MNQQIRGLLIEAKNKIDEALNLLNPKRREKGNDFR